MLLKSKLDFIYTLQQGGGQPHVYPKDLSKIEIPIPPIDIQMQIVSELDGYRKIIAGAEEIIGNYKITLPYISDATTVEIGGICTKVQYGISDKLNTENKGFKVFRMNELVGGFAIDRGNMKYVDIGVKEFHKYKLEEGDVLFNRTNSYEHVGRTGIYKLNGDYCFASYLIRLSVNKSKVLPDFLNLYMNTKEFQSGIKQKATRAVGQANINAQSLKQAVVALPSLESQKQIIELAKKEREHIVSAKKLAELFEEKIKLRINEVWGE